MWNLKEGIWFLIIFLSGSLGIFGYNKLFLSLNPSKTKAYTIGIILIIIYIALIVLSKAWIK